VKLSRLAIIGLGLWSTALLLFFARPKHQPAPTRAQVYAQAISHYYAVHGVKNQWTDPAWLEAVALTTELWCDRFGIEGMEPWALSMFAVESGMNPAAVGPAHELGLGQTTRRSEIYHGAILRRMGFAGTIADPDWQIALSISEFKWCLERSAGDPRLAAMRYNGRGYHARRHAIKVSMFYLQVFAPLVKK